MDCMEEVIQRIDEFIGLNEVAAAHDGNDDFQKGYTTGLTDLKGFLVKQMEYQEENERWNGGTNNAND